jgi:hypothetical protein
MDTKLTLRLEERLIRRAKRHAQRRRKSVSQLVAGYFDALGDMRVPRDVSLPPLTRELLGALRGANVDERDYRGYLEEKHR